jgi:FAD/FMN-containing dehydrogenase
MKLEKLSFIALLLAGLGTTGIIASTVVHLFQVVLSEQLWLSVGGLSLAALGVIVLVVAAYAQRQLTFNFFALLMVGVLVLITAAFLILMRLNP